MKVLATVWCQYRSLCISQCLFLSVLGVDPTVRSTFAQVRGIEYSSVQSLRRVWLFVTPWTAARQAFLSITNCWSLLRLMSIVSWCHPSISSSVISFPSCLQSFPASGSFPMSQFFPWGGQSIGASALVLSMISFRIDWFDLLAVQGMLKSFLHTVQKDQFFGT